MDEESIREKLKQISNVMDTCNLETMKIATIQADLCEVKKENTMLKERVSSLEQENTNLKGELSTVKGELSTVRGELSTLKNENTILRGLNKTVLDKISKSNEENTVLRNTVDTLRNDFDVFRSKFMEEREPHFGGRKKEVVDEGEANVAGGTNEAVLDEKELSVAGDNLANSRRKPKTQRKREQNEIFRNWRKTMMQRKTSEVLWASGLLKVTVELWEDGESAMDDEQILDFTKRNVEQLTTFISSQESKERFFLTINKMCSIRKVSKQKFEEIMLCFVNQGPQRHRITEAEVQKFIEIYKE